jgi:hypothetical protein
MHGGDGGIGEGLASIAPNSMSARAARSAPSATARSSAPPISLSASQASARDSGLLLGLADA